MDIQAALNAKAQPSGPWSQGGLVILPAGTYVIDQTLVIPNGVRLVGEGRGASYIVPSPIFDGTTPMVNLGDNAGGNVFGVRLDAVTLNGLNQVSTLVYTQRANEQCGVHGCTILNYTNTGIHVEQRGTSFEIDDCQIFGGTAQTFCSIYYNVTSGNLLLRDVNTGGGNASVGAQQYGIYAQAGWIYTEVTHGEYEVVHIRLVNARGTLNMPKGHNYVNTVVLIDDAGAAGPGIREVLVVNGYKNNSLILIDDRPNKSTFTSNCCSIYSCKTHMEY